MQAKTLVDEEHPEDIFDEYLLGACPDEDLLSTLDIAFQCLVQQPQARPSMKQVVKMLEGLRPDLGCGDNSSLGFSSSRLMAGSQSGMISSSTSSSTVSSAMMSALSTGSLSAVSTGPLQSAVPNSAPHTL